MRRRLILIAAVVLVLIAVPAVFLQVYDRPPLHLLLRYGLPPAGGATGRTRTDSGGVECVEVGPGYVKVERHVLKSRGDVHVTLWGHLDLSPDPSSVIRLMHGDEMRLVLISPKE